VPSHIQVGRNSEAEPYTHAGGIAFDRRINEFLDTGEIDNFVKSIVDFPLPHAKDATVQEDIFPTGQFRMHPGADFEE